MEQALVGDDLALLAQEFDREKEVSILNSVLFAPVVLEQVVPDLTAIGARVVCCHTGGFANELEINATFFLENLVFNLFVSVGGNLGILLMSAG